MDYLLFSLGVLTIIFTLIAGVSEHKKNKKIALASIIIIGFLGLLSLIAQSIKDYDNTQILAKKDSIINSKTNKIKDKSDSIYKLQQEIDIKTQTISLKQNQLIDTQNKVVTTQESLIGYTTGGKDNKPVLILKYIYSYDFSRIIVTPIIKNYGNYPLKNVTFSFNKEDFQDASKEILDININQNKIHNILNNPIFNETLNYGTISKGAKGAFAFYYINELSSYSNEYELMGEVRWSDGNYVIFIRSTYDKEDKSFKVLDYSIDDVDDIKKLNKFFPLVPKGELLKKESIHDDASDLLFLN